MPEKFPQYDGKKSTAEDRVDVEIVHEGRTDRQTYNIFTDTLGGGVNIRKSDNILQAKAVGIGFLLGTLLGAGSGAWVGELGEIIGGALVGGFCGVLAGLFGSGFYLMIYRARKHLRGEHD